METDKLIRKQSLSTISPFAEPANIIKVYDKVL